VRAILGERLGAAASGVLYARRFLLGDRGDHADKTAGTGTRASAFWQVTLGISPDYPATTLQPGSCGRRDEPVASTPFLVGRLVRVPPQASTPNCQSIRTQLPGPFGIATT
jgi:hypothetical protein